MCTAWERIEINMRNEWKRAGSLDELAHRILGTRAPTLHEVFQFELARGNRVERIDAPAGTLCPYAVALTKPLQRAEIEKQLALPPSLRWWESRDPHYAIEAGYVCEEHPHTLTVPIG